MKTKALISFAVSAKLICVFVFANAKRWFSHDGPQIIVYLAIKLQLGAVAQSVAVLPGMLAVLRLIPVLGTFFREDLVMKIFLRPFFL